MLQTETLVDEGGIEITVDYQYEREPEGLFFELNTVEVVISGRGINKTKMLNETQKQSIINQLTAHQ